MTFTMMVGVPGAGKSTVANRLAQVNNAIVLSSDAIRAELYGSEDAQQNPGRVFGLMNQRTCDALSRGASVIYDATNLSKARRIATLKMISKYHPATLCYVVNTPIEIAIDRNNHRERIVPISVIRRMYNQMEVPILNEGWDRIDFENA